MNNKPTLDNKIELRFDLTGTKLNTLNWFFKQFDIKTMFFSGANFIICLPESRAWFSSGNILSRTYLKISPKTKTFLYPSNLNIRCTKEMKKKVVDIASKSCKRHHYHTLAKCKQHNHECWFCLFQRKPSLHGVLV